ncbi:MAG TPA: hypothetical protein VJS37_03940, partial [Terriglobales bacterium]|nr:hypothetical protein [Terriglobales bacterium]
MQVRRKVLLAQRSYDRTVYVKRNGCAYNLRMRRALETFRLRVLLLLVLVSCAPGQQQGPSSDQPEITTKELPAANLWNPYSFRLETNEGTENLNWRMAGGSLAHDLQLRVHGTIEGVVNELGTFDLTVIAIDRGGSSTKPKRFALQVEPPLKADWVRKSQVNGNRIDGSIKVSNTTGRDFDLTFDVLAVNEIGRATAIGYQHFTLQKNTRDMELPFGDTLAPGSYVVNVDVVAEEP